QPRARPRSDAARSGRPPRAPRRRQSPRVSGALGPRARLRVSGRPAGGPGPVRLWRRDGTAPAPASPGRARSQKATRAGKSLQLETRFGACVVLPSVAARETNTLFLLAARSEPAFALPRRWASAGRRQGQRMKEGMSNNSTTSISQARKAVEQLKMEACMDRVKVSQAAADLLAYCEAHVREDPLIIPVPASENPFREKKFFCTIL
uniref:Guanine nucleotide-binding protein subunit gamma n=1 Tax=Felis catus TaxID=9685 RepID=A0ABI7YZS8_FELCA